MEGSYGQNAVFMSAKEYGGSELTAPIPYTGYPNWKQIEIAHIPVSNGQLRIGFYSKGNAGNWMSVDDVQLMKE